MEHGGDKEQRADALASYYSRRRLRIECRLADKAAIEKARHQQGSHAHGMKQRHYAQRYLAMAVVQLGQTGQRRVLLGGV